MSPKGLSPATRHEIIKRFRTLGWEGPRKGGDHQFMVNGTRKVKMPNPHGSEVGIGLIALILRQAGISTDEWNEAGAKKKPKTKVKRPGKTRGRPHDDPQDAVQPSDNADDQPDAGGGGHRLRPLQ